MADLQTVYSNDPWAGINSNQRQWYDPLLQNTYRRATVFADMVPYATQPMLAANAKTMTFNFAYDFAPTGAEPTNQFRYNEVQPSQLDGYQVDITFDRYQFQTAYDKFDQYVSYWRANGGNAGLAGLIQERIGRNVAETLDLMIRNAFINTPMINLPSPSYTGADQITASDKFDLTMIDQSILRAQTMNVFTGPTEAMQKGTLAIIGTPGHEYDIVTGATNSRWIELQKYAGTTPFNSFEIGSYHNSRFFRTNANILWNCGTKTAQAPITVAAGPLDGAPDPASSKVDGVYKVGQAGSGAIHSITLGTFSTGTITNILVGDMVTVHKRKNQAADVTANPKLRVLGAPPFEEATAVVRRVVSKTGTTLTFDRPLLVDYKTEVNAAGTGVATPGSAVYGFVTKGINLHAGIAIADKGGVMNAVMAPPRVYTPPPIDTYDSVYRVAWDAYMKFQLVRPEAYEVFLTAGSTRVANGPVAYGN